MINKFYGAIGYAETKETAPGVWVDEITERKYCGDLTKNMRRLDSSDRVTDDVTISNTASIIADPYAYDNFHAIRYLRIRDVKWRITSVEVQYPRLLLSIGGLYNENEN